jgi:hypothetical protein
MEDKYLESIHYYFRKLVEIYGFRIRTELNDGQSFLIEYSSVDIIVKVENYFREIYVSLYKVTDPDNGINLFNLLKYLMQGAINIPESNYFHKEKDLEESFRKQLEHISTVFYENYDTINAYFTSGNYESRVADFEKFWRHKYPNLHKEN